MTTSFRRNFFIICFIFLSIVSFAQIKVIPYQELPTSSGATSGSGIFFGANMSVSTITVSFEGPSNKWIALGLGQFMNPTDVLIYSNGKPGALHALGWNDYYNSSTLVNGVNNDLSQDWTIVSNNVASGQRTVVATRALNTNDANDVAISFTAAALNIVWAKNATNDYTIAYHGSSNRAYNISLPWLSTPSPSFSAASTTVCLGSPVTFSNSTTGGQTTYTWTFQGANLATSSGTNPTITYTAAGVYSVALTASNAVGTGTFVQNNYITVTPTVVPGISINQSAGTNPICQGALASFSANFTNGGPSPAFQWKVNGSNAGSNSASFSSSTLPNPAVITCIMTSGSVCASPSVNTSAAITLTVNSNAPAAVSIGLSAGSNPMCNGASATFSATPGNGGINPTYQWKVNNLNVGSNSPTYSTISLLNADVVSCGIVSSATCASTSTANSNGITMTVSSVLVPSVGIGISTGSNPICSGMPLSFSASGVNCGSNPGYQWKLNGTNTGSNSAVFTSSNIPNGAVISCVMTSNSSCSSPNTATSSVITITVIPTPSAPVINPAGSVSLCAGTGVLQSSAPNGNTWSNGANTPSIVINSSGTYTVTQTSNGCTSPPSSAVTVVALPTPTCLLNPIGDFCNNASAINLQGVPAGGAYSGTGVSGNQFSPSAAGAGTFVLVYQVTGSNGCSDTSAISSIISDCTGLEAQKEILNVVSLFPNPGKGHFEIRSGNEKIKSLRLRDLNGKLLMEVPEINANNYFISVHTFATGIYQLEIRLASKTVIMRLINSE